MKKNLRPLRPEALFWAACLAGLSPWIAAIFAHSINYDVAWLLEAAARFLRGGTMQADFYETNPPLSIIIMTPPVLLSWLTGIPVYHTATVYFLVILGFSTLAVHRLLTHLGFLNARGINVFTAAWLAFCIVLPATDFGERDHLTLMGLLPFLLTQAAITGGKKLPRKLKWPVLCAGTILILLKPHHGILPTLMLAHRFFVNRRYFKVLRDPDFLFLSSGTTLYLLAVFAFFGDYLREIAPDIVALYLPMRQPGMLEKLAYYGLMAVLFLIVSLFLPAKKDMRTLVAGLFLAALVSLIPYYVQGKDYWYHLVPAVTFFCIGALMAAHTLLEKFFPGRRHAMLTALAAIVLAHIIVPLNTAFPTHAQIREMEITRLIEQCPAPCPFFIFNSSLGIIHPTAVYTGQFHASRFPSFWFVPTIVREEEKPERLTAEKTTRYREKYMRLVARDFQRYRPEIIMLGRFRVSEGAPWFDFVRFFSADPIFAEEWKNYEFDKSIEINNRIYYRGTNLDRDDIIPFDVYRRKKN